MRNSQAVSAIGKGISLVSKSQKYQKKVMVLCTFVCLEIALSNLISTTIFTNPLFKCNGVVTPQSIACQRLDECQVENSYTGTYHVGLICEQSMLRMNIQALFIPGLIIGILVFSILSDCKGRKYAFVSLISTLTLGQILLFLGIIFKSIWVIGLAHFMCGFSSTGGLNISFSIAKELFSDSRRQTSSILYCSAWCMVSILVFFIYELAPYWWTYLVIFGIIPSILLTYYSVTLLVETPQFIYTIQANMPKAMESLQKIGKYNEADQNTTDEAKRILTKIVEERPSVRVSVAQQAHQFLQIIRKIRSNKQYISSICCLIILRFAALAFYYGAFMCLERTGFSFGITILLLGISEYIGYSIGANFIERIRRKHLLIISTILKIGFSLAFLSSTVTESSVLSTSILVICFFIGTFNWSALTIIETQSFQNSIQSTAIGIIYMMSFISRMILPYMIGYMNESSMHPLAACAVFSLVFGIIPSFFIKETLKQGDLQNNIVEYPSEQIEMKEMNKQHNFISRLSRLSTVSNTMVA